MVENLTRNDRCVVFAESCTGGQIASLISDIPGASKILAGGFVVYQCDSKSGWIDVDRQLIDQHTAVSDPVARAMVQGILDKTPHADVALAITGHFGPAAPEDLDGVCFIATGDRQQIIVHRVQLTRTDRSDRKTEAITRSLEQLHEYLS